MDTKHPIPKKYQKKVAAIIHEPPDGYFIYTKNGWNCGDTGLHCIAEDTLVEARRRLSMILPCDCEDCIAGTMDWKL